MKKFVISLLPVIFLLTSCSETSESCVSNKTQGFLQGEIKPGMTYKIGDTMYDFTLTDLEGDSYTFSNVLEEKELLVLNFFFTTCGPCQVEFPYLEQVYQEVKDRVEVIAIDPKGESKETVYNFINDRGYTFPVSCENNTYFLRSAFAVDTKGYPTSVVIGKNGVILNIHTGSLNSYSLMNEFITEYLD